MNNQATMFDQFAGKTNPVQLSRRDHPQTSKDAAARYVASGKHAERERQAFELVKAHPGRTGGELDRLAACASREVSKRLAGLKRKGAIRSGPVRPCAALGSKCKTWWPVEGSSG